MMSCMDSYYTRLYLSLLATITISSFSWRMMNEFLTPKNNNMVRIDAFNAFLRARIGIKKSIFKKGLRAFCFAMDIGCT